MDKDFSVLTIQRTYFLPCEIFIFSSFLSDIFQIKRLTENAFWVIIDFFPLRDFDSPGYHRAAFQADAGARKNDIQSLELRWLTRSGYN